MSSDVIKANILLDTVSMTATQYYTSYNHVGWTSPSQVPRYLYTCLADLCSGSLSQVVISDYGLAQTPATLAIIIQPTTIQDSSTAGWINSDQIGAEYGEFNILVKNVRTATDISPVRDIGLRLRYILDYNLRSLSSNQFMISSGQLSPDLSIVGDNQIDPNGMYKTSWKGSDTLRAAQQSHMYCAEWTRQFNFDYGNGPGQESY